AVRVTENGPAGPDDSSSTMGWAGPDPAAATASAPGKSTPAPHRAEHSTDRDNIDRIAPDALPAHQPPPLLPAIPAYRVVDEGGPGVRPAEARRGRAPPLQSVKHPARGRRRAAGPRLRAGSVAGRRYGAVRVRLRCRHLAVRVVGAQPGVEGGLNPRVRHLRA